MRIHRVKELPALLGLNPGDLYNVKPDGETMWRLWKVDNQGVPHFVTGLTNDESNRLSQLTQEVIDKIVNFNPDTDLGLTIGPEPPENLDDLWVDNSDLVPDPTEESDVVTSLRVQINDLLERMNAVEYRFDFNLDSGDFDNKAGTTQFRDNIDIEPGDAEDPVFNPNNSNYDGDFTTTDDDGNDEGDDEGNDLDVGDGEEPSEPVEDANLKHLRIKRGLYATFKPDSLQDGELGYVKDRNLLYIGNNGTPRLIGSGGGGGGGGGELDGPIPFLDLEVEGNSAQIYRVKVTADGELMVYDAAIDDADNQQILTPGAEELKGLYISMFYAGGTSTTESLQNPCSHNFIELYNYRNEPINLKGLSIQYSRGGSTWEALPLKGIIPSQTAFTIRGARCAPKNINTTLVEIDKYDMDWPDMRLATSGVKIYLTVGVQPCDVPNPFNTRGAPSTFRDGYIDLVGIGGSLTSQTIDGYETSFPNIMTPKRAIYRLYFADYNQRPAGTRWGDTNNNKANFTYIEYDKSLWTDNTKSFKPWTVSDGKKDLYYDKNSWYDDKPNMLTNSFGRNAHTTRTFNWISVGYYDEHLQYRVKGATEWITVESIKDEDSLYKRKIIKGFDDIWFTVHKQIISPLTAGVYEYRAGRLNTDYWSDIYEFEIKSSTNTFGFVMTADQQAWNWHEYEPWRISCEHIEKWENDQDPEYPATGTKEIDWILNVGDMTENGIRPHEWLYYYEAGKDILPKYAQMNVVGNNDLCPNPGQLIGKINPDSFDWFYTYEHNPNNVPMFNGETMKSVFSYDYGNAHFVTLNTNNYIEEQKEWFIKDMQEVHGRTEKPRWIVVQMHDACFNIITDVAPTRNTGFNQITNSDLTKRYSWSRLFEEWGVHLVLSGHKHTYARSKPLLERVDENGVVIPLQPIAQTLGTPTTGETQVSEITGVVYLMSQATGSKLDSNRDVPATSIYWNAYYFPGVGGSSNSAQYYPTYIKLDFTQDRIVHHSYQIKNIMPASSYSYDPYNPITLPKERILIDTSEITKKWKNI